MDLLIALKNNLIAELDNFVVKDTYSKGKNAGLRKAIVLIDDIIEEHKAYPLMSKEEAQLLSSFIVSCDGYLLRHILAKSLQTEEEIESAVSSLLKIFVKLGNIAS